MNLVIDYYNRNNKVMSKLKTQSIYFSNSNNLSSIIKSYNVLKEYLNSSNILIKNIKIIKPFSSIFRPCVYIKPNETKTLSSYLMVINFFLKISEVKYEIKYITTYNELDIHNFYSAGIIHIPNQATRDKWFDMYKKNKGIIITIPTVQTFKNTLYFNTPNL